MSCRGRPPPLLIHVDVVAVLRTGQVEFFTPAAVSLTGSVAEPWGYAKVRHCDTAGGPLRIDKQYRYGIRAAFLW
jgi:hypothetical protein